MSAGEESGSAGRVTWDRAAGVVQIGGVPAGKRAAARFAADVRRWVSAGEAVGSYGLVAVAGERVTLDAARGTATIRGVARGRGGEALVADLRLCLRADEIVRRAGIA